MNMKSRSKYLVGSVCIVCLSVVYVPANADLKATGQLIVDTIKNGCKKEYPNDEEQFRKCAMGRYDAMKSFHEKLYHYRDTKGVNSVEFKKGISCVDRASPSVDEPGRKVAIEKADWIKANKCYESELK